MYISPFVFESNLTCFVQKDPGPYGPGPNISYYVIALTN